MPKVLRIGLASLAVIWVLGCTLFFYVRYTLVFYAAHQDEIDAVLAWFAAAP